MTTSLLLTALSTVTVVTVTAKSNLAVQPFDKLGAYSGPFTQLTANFLDGIADPTDQFGMEDKMVQCNGDIVFIDLDPDINDVYLNGVIESTRHFGKLQEFNLYFKYQTTYDLAAPF
jgi:hypothetical protein